MKLSIAIVALGLAACASAPVRSPHAQEQDTGFETLRDQRNYRVSAYRAPTPPDAVPFAPVPAVRLLPEAYSTPVTAAEADLVARNLGRRVCTALSPYVQWQESASPGQHAIVAQISRIDPTQAGVSVASALLDAAVPGPFRLPTGLGGLSAELFWRDGSGELVLGMRWARGANPLLQTARASSIGDAWELAPAFARDARRVWRDGNPPELSKEAARASRDVCDAAFGTLPAAGQAASRFVPLSPAALEPGQRD